ncbi:trace amine-associated receptor 1-like [Xiphophorus maculatus]|uniref:trace amine-associated receptor 1-like n=1 Tax=Xiphophorus maculatus TaxID=8083 RepID=UPI000C6CD28A|nr:trace amine-associated receptor 1-like [Xiphophorus maculatus]
MYVELTWSPLLIGKVVATSSSPPDVAEYKEEVNVSSKLCVLLYIFLAVAAVVTVCGNLLIIVSVGYFTQLHTPTNSLIVSLAATDLLVGVLVFPFSMAFSLSSCLLHEGLICQVRDTFDISLSTCSILNLCCIAVDRYYAVCQPLAYRTKMTNSIAVAMILASWSISGLIGIGITIAGLNHEPCEENCSMEVLLSSTLGPTFSFYLPALIMLCIYLKIFLVAQRQARVIHINKNSGGTASKRERKATKTLAIVMGVFLICWTPLFVCITLVPFSADPVPVSVIETLNWVTLTNSMLNPFIYAFFYSWYRTAFRMIVSGKIFQGDFANSKLS